MHVKVREKLEGVSPAPLPYESQVLNSGHHVWNEAPMSAGTSQLLNEVQFSFPIPLFPGLSS